MKKLVVKISVDYPGTDACNDVTFHHWPLLYQAIVCVEEPASCLTGKAGLIITFRIIPSGSLKAWRQANKSPAKMFLFREQATVECIKSC